MDKTGQKTHKLEDTEAKTQGPTGPAEREKVGEFQHVNAEGQTVNAAPGSVAHDWEGTHPSDLPKRMDDNGHLIEDRQFLTEFAPTASKTAGPELVDEEAKSKTEG